MTIAILPYFAQVNPSWERYSPEDLRFTYLKATINSLKKLVDRIIVYTQNQDDHDNALYIPNIEIEVVECFPKDLPQTTVTHFQDNHDPTTDDYIIYSETDHIFTCPNFETILETLSLQTYIAPHRIDQCPIKNMEGRLEQHFTPSSNIVELESEFKERAAQYVVSNHPLLDDEFLAYDDYFFVTQSESSSYGGAWICTRDFFMDTVFEYDSNPGENIGGRIMFNRENCVCLKTIDPMNFYVEHLSAYHQNKIGRY